MVDCVYIIVIVLALTAILWFLSLYDIAYYFVKFAYDFTQHIELYVEISIKHKMKFQRCIMEK